MHSALIRSSILTDLPVISTWVTNQEECDLWSGGVVPFPIDRASLPQQIIWDSAQSWTVTSSEHVVGYGQIILKPEGRHHLARILVDPENSRATALYLSLGFKPVIDFEASHKGAFVYMEYQPVIIQSP
ncbi:MAG: hypothetical protein O3B41_01395 [Bacteroidetes bacterium]|nr:hypothetical protein [Bacteroidota bacterium]